MTNRPDSSGDRELAEQAELAPHSFVRELWDLIRFNKKWWLTPVILALVILGAIIILGGTAAAPFIYTLF
jgi:hypothetical protein